MFHVSEKTVIQKLVLSTITQQNRSGHVPDLKKMGDIG
jgi:hypothetical protein